MKEQLTVKALYAYPEHTRAWELLGMKPLSRQGELGL